jgi:hypothetical protein
MNEIKFEALKKVGKIDFKSRNLSSISKISSVSPPSVFVGSGLKYPNMNVGILSPIEREEDAWIYDDCKFWAKNDFGINDVVRLRESLLNSRVTQKAKDVRFNNKFLDIAKEIAVASKPVDVEIELKRKIDFNRKRDRVLMPSALGAPLENARITSNVSINNKLDKVMNDDLKATDSIRYLYKNNFDEYSLSKILSIGVLGMKKDKKLVPTRWSITATDDIICKSLLEKVKTYKEIQDFSFNFGEFLGNQYLILFFPGIFSFELFELYFPGSSWNPSDEIKACTDLEFFDGRKEYAKECAGGYYATRLAITEYLESIKRQASVLVIRLETPSYWASLGVWVVRESVKKALEKQMKFSSKEELLSSCIKIGKIKYNFDSNLIFVKSKLLKYLSNQKRLNDFF